MLSYELHASRIQCGYCSHEFTPPSQPILQQLCVTPQQQQLAALWRLPQQQLQHIMLQIYMQQQQQQQQLQQQQQQQQELSTTAPSTPAPPEAAGVGKVKRERRYSKSGADAPPKRARSARVIYTTSNRGDMKKMHPNVTTTDMTRILQQQYDALSQTEKQQWIDMGQTHSSAKWARQAGVASQLTRGGCLVCAAFFLSATAEKERFNVHMAEYKARQLQQQQQQQQQLLQVVTPPSPSAGVTDAQSTPAVQPAAMQDDATEQLQLATSTTEDGQPPPLVEEPVKMETAAARLCDANGRTACASSKLSAADACRRFASLSFFSCAQRVLSSCKLASSVVGTIAAAGTEAAGARRATRGSTPPPRAPRASSRITMVRNSSIAVCCVCTC